MENRTTRKQFILSPKPLLLLADFFTEFNTFLQQIKNESREIRLYIAGAGLEDELCREDLLLFRQKTLDKIATAGLAKQLHCVQWARGKSTQWLRLNLQENDAIYAEHFDEEPRDRIKYRIVR